MLESIGGGVQNNRLLQAVIVFLIIQALLARDVDSQKDAVDELIDLLGNMTGRASHHSLSMQSSSTIIRTQYDSSAHATYQALTVSPGAPSQGSDASGPTDKEVDISA